MSTRDFSQEDHQIIKSLRESSENARAFFEEHRDELRHMVSLRMDKRLSRRMDPSDIVQEAFVRYSAVVDDYLASTPKPPLIWLRFFVRKVLYRLTKKHLQSQCRDVLREANAEVDIDQIADSFSSLGGGLYQAELREQLLELFNSMSNIDREILALVHFEGKTIPQAAQELDINFETAKKRYRRAVNRLAKSSRISELEVYQK